MFSPRRPFCYKSSLKLSTAFLLSTGAFPTAERMFYLLNMLLQWLSVNHRFGMYNTILNVFFLEKLSFCVNNWSSFCVAIICILSIDRWRGSFLRGIRSDLELFLGRMGPNSVPDLPVVRALSFVYIANHFAQEETTSCDRRQFIIQCLLTRVIQYFF